MGGPPKFEAEICKALYYDVVTEKITTERIDTMDLSTIQVPFNWVCPTCAAKTTIDAQNFRRVGTPLYTPLTQKSNIPYAYLVLIECPNKECAQEYIEVQIRRSEQNPYDSSEYEVIEDTHVGLGRVVFCPELPQPLSGDVPKYVKGDYNEAYLIRNFSPKASATLARRALQGMVRDFWGVTARTLFDELKAIEDKCDPDLYGAMMGLRSVGNIGAHPERDINAIVDVETGEAESLLELIHLLDEEWYVTRANRKRRIAKVLQIGTDKKETVSRG